MNVKNINGVSRPDTGNSVAAETPRAETRGAPRERDGNTDQVTLTTVTRRLIGASGTPADAPPVNQSRVEALREAIAAGHYKVDTKRIAEQLLRLERDLPG